MNRIPQHIGGVLLVVVALVMLTGCSTYKLRGKVMDGSVSAMRVVNADSEQLQGMGIGGAQVTAILDPDQPSRKKLPEVYTDADGNFALPIDEVGAGFLEYEVLISVRLPRMSPAVRRMALPTGNQRLLITLSAGQDMVPYEQRDIVEETLRLQEQLDR